MGLINLARCKNCGYSKSSHKSKGFMPSVSKVCDKFISLDYVYYKYYELGQETGGI